jgi:hypothetical protein
MVPTMCLVLILLKIDKLLRSSIEDEPSSLIAVDATDLAEGNEQATFIIHERREEVT